MTLRDRVAAACGANGKLLPPREPPPAPLLISGNGAGEYRTNGEDPLSDGERVENVEAREFDRSASMATAALISRKVDQPAAC